MITVNLREARSGSTMREIKNANHRGVHEKLTLD